MSKEYVRKELTEMFNLNTSEKGVITHKFGYIPEGTKIKLYSEEDVIAIKEMLYWKRECIGLPDFVARFGIPRDMVRIRLDIVNSIPDREKKMVAKGWRIRPEYLCKLKSEYSLLSELEKESYITSVQAVRELKISGVRFKKYVSLFSLKNVHLHPLHNSVYCIPSEEYKRLVASLVFIDEPLKILTIDNKTYVNKNTADSKVGLELLTFKTLIDRKLISDFIVSFSKKTKQECLYALEDSLIDFKTVIDKTISVDELSTYDNRFNAPIMHRIINGPKGVIGTFPNAFHADFSQYIHYRIYLEDVDAFIINEIDAIIHRNNQKSLKDPYELLDYTVNKYIEDSNYIETVLDYKEFINNMLYGYDGSKHRDFVKNQLNVLDYMIRTIQKDILEYSDAELELLFRTYERDTYYLTQFLNYLLAFKKEVCNFNNTYIANRKTSKIDLKKSKENVYTFEEWARYALYAMNLSIHKYKAFQSAYYARAWTYVIIHFVAAWRKSDILNISGLEMISDEDIKELYSKLQYGDIELSEAESLIASLKDLINVTIASKNMQKIMMVVPEDMKIPVASALLISEHHRRECDEVKLFGRFGGRNLEAVMKSEEIQGFSNLKATRTLLSLFYVEANKESSLTAYAYELGRQLRGHKIDYKNLYSSTTAVYLYAMNSDGDVNAVAYELLRRGTFGYVFLTLAKVAGETENTSMSELSSIMVDLRNTYSSLGLESAASQVIRSNEMKKVINEIVSMPLEQVKKIMMDLALGKAQAKTMYTQCLKYSMDCPFEYVKTCFGCPYNIPSTYAMRLLNDQVISIVEQLMSLADNDITMKLKYSKDLYNHLAVLQEFKGHFDQVDKKYLSSFIDLGQLKQDLIQLQGQGKLLSLEE